MAKRGVTEVATVFVQVADAERALAFYTEVLGFEVRADFSYGDGDRWLEVAPPGAANSLALVSNEGHPGVPHESTLCALPCEDLEAVHAALERAGAEVDPIATEGNGREGLFLSAATIDDPTPPQFLFRDPDGNRFLAVRA